MFFIFASVFAAAFAALLTITLLWYHSFAIVGTMITGIGAVVFFSESDAKMRWAAKFNDSSKCPHCGSQYVVRWWSRNNAEH